MDGPEHLPLQGQECARLDDLLARVRFRVGAIRPLVVDDGKPGKDERCWGLVKLRGSVRASHAAAPGSNLSAAENQFDASETIRRRSLEEWTVAK